MQEVLTGAGVMGAVMAFFIATAAAPLMARAMRAIGWVDRPDTRKRHSGHVPLAGGALVVGAVFTVASLLHTVHFSRGFWVGGLLLFALGFIDDKVPIRARYRLVVQIAACGAAIAWDGSVLRDLGRPFGDFLVPLGFVAVPVTIFCMCGLVNAVNMSDGMDGLAGGQTFVTLLWLGLVTLVSAVEVPAVVTIASPQAAQIATLMAAVLGFLVWNLRTPIRPRAAIFLGDAGSTFLGFCVAWFALRVADSAGAFRVPPVIVLMIVGLPVVDVASCIVRRVFVERRTPFSPDRRHMHHLLLSYGMRTNTAAAALIGAQFVLGGVAFALWRLGVSEHLVVLASGIGFSIYLWWSLAVWARADVQVATVEAAREMVPAIVQRPSL